MSFLFQESVEFGNLPESMGFTFEAVALEFEPLEKVRNELYLKIQDFLRPMATNKLLLLPWFTDRYRSETTGNFGIEIRKWTKLHRRLLVATTAEDFNLLYKHRLCQDRKAHDSLFTNDYEVCKFANQCFTDEGNKYLMKRVNGYKVWPLIEHAPDHIRKKLSI